MATSFSNLSVVVPVGAYDEKWEKFLLSAKFLPQDAEIIFVSPQALDVHPSFQNFLRDHPNTQYLKSEPGRARQLNRGAHLAEREFIWFLHADSTFDEKAVDAVQKAIQSNPEALWFFELAFASDGPRLVKLNEFLVSLRSNFLKIPFGDQGFLIKKEIFMRLGAYPENLAYGEDHVFVWRARSDSVAILSTGVSLETSARKYAQKGWAHTTAKHVYLTFKQAVPEALRLIAKRVQAR